MDEENKIGEESKQNSGESSWTDIDKRGFAECGWFDGTVWSDKQWNRISESSTWCKKLIFSSRLNMENYIASTLISWSL